MKRAFPPASLVVAFFALATLAVSALPARGQDWDGGHQGWSPSGGVTLYSGTNRTGRSDSFRDDVPDLWGTRIGNRATRSVGVSPGCVAVLFEYPRFAGRKIEIRESDNDLGNTALGRDSVQSLKVRCTGQGGGGGGGGRGVTLFRDRSFNGPSQVFNRDVRDLSYTVIGARRASSIAVPRGCRAMLYDQTDYRGRSTEFRDDDANLSNTPVGEDTAMSIRVDCGGGGGGDWGGGGGGPRPPDRPSGPGVTLFSQRNLRGDAQTFSDDVQDLRRTPFGTNRASSATVSRGCKAVLYELPNYGGRWVEIRDTDNDLGNTPIGENNVSSLRVRCGGGGYPPEPPRPPGPAGGRGVTLFRDRDQRGPSQFFDRDVSDLSRTSIGSRTASSVDVTPGCVATLYQFPGYGGRSTDFREADNNLSNTGVGEDTASSLRIRCSPR